MNPLWSWVLAGIGVFGLWLLTRKDWRGYIVGLAVQVLWIAYAIATWQLGFIASALAYGAVNVWGLRQWRVAAAHPPVCPDCLGTGYIVCGKANCAGGICGFACTSCRAGVAS